MSEIPRYWSCSSTPGEEGSECVKRGKGEEKRERAEKDE